MSVEVVMMHILLAFRFLKSKLVQGICSKPHPQRLAFSPSRVKKMIRDISDDRDRHNSPRSKILS